MIREDILAMGPGEAMNTLVAEKVMGWSKRFLPMSDMEYWFNPNSDDTVSMPWVKDWKPSEDIIAAWEVVEGMDRKYAFEIGRAGDYFAPDDKWKARFGMSGWAEAESAPEAICKAALLAILDKEDSA